MWLRTFVMVRIVRSILSFILYLAAALATVPLHELLHAIAAWLRGYDGAVTITFNHPSVWLTGNGWMAQANAHWPGDHWFIYPIQAIFLIATGLVCAYWTIDKDLDV